MTNQRDRTKFSLCLGVIIAFVILVAILIYHEATKPCAHTGRLDDPVPVWYSDISWSVSFSTGYDKFIVVVCKKCGKALAVETHQKPTTPEKP